jgi:deazaflavin-dependent oxidoreductase (nitroreductase family)
VLTVTTTGARTGQRRTAPLLGVPAGEDIAVIGTSFGQPRTPGWYHNISCRPPALHGMTGQGSAGGRIAHAVAAEATGSSSSPSAELGCGPGD